MKKQLLLILMTLLPMLANANQSGTCGDNVTWTFVEATNTLTISGNGAMESYSKIKEVPWYSFRENIEKLVVEEGVTSIGKFCFRYCSGLTSITIPKSLTRIGENAFADTGWYNNQENGFIYLDNWLIGYKDDMSFEPLTIKEGTVGIADRALMNQMNCFIPVIFMPNSILYIGREAFSNDQNSDIDGDGNKIYLMSPIAAIYTNSSDEPPVIIDGNYWFLSVDEVNVYVPWRSIEKYKIADGWKNLNICTEPVCLNSLNFEAISDNEVKVTRSIDAKGNVVIPESIIVYEKNYQVTEIDDQAFSGCTDLTSVTIPKSVTSIGNSAFSGCSGITSITIPNSVTSIGNSAFSGCSGITSITIPNSVTSIGNSAFRGCSGITSITIPNSVTSIGRSAFMGCSSLTSITVLCNPTNIGSSIFSGCTIIKEAVFECETITSLLSGLKSLETITIKESVTNIADNAFAQCSGLTSVTIPQSVISIGHQAFKGCSGLSSINIPYGVVSIDKNAFSECTNLNTVSISSSVNYIGDGAFNRCNKLTAVHITDIESWCKIQFSDKWYRDNTEYSSTPLYYAHHLYLNGEEVKDVVIPNSITSIDEFAFQFCTELTSVTIPSSVTAIGKKAFKGCENLMIVKSEITEPFNCTNLFSENTYRKGTLYVPAGTKDLYSRFDGWREFLKIEEVGSAEPQQYLLSFVVDNKELSAKKVDEGTTITPPTKDSNGNTISWYTYPATMPAHDLVVYGMTAKQEAKKYTLSYYIDNAIYKSYKYEEGETIPTETVPYKEGYTFSGWQNVPSTMPGRDISFNGTYSVNKYRLSFIADNVELEAKSVEFGRKITAPKTDNKGNTVTWYTYPTTMPAHDLAVYGMTEKGTEQETSVWLTVNDSQSGYMKIKVKQGVEQTLNFTAEEGWKISNIFMDGRYVTSRLQEDGTFVTPAITSDASIIIVYEEETPSGVRAAQSRADVKVVDDGVIISNAGPDSHCVIYQTGGKQVVNTVIDEGTRKITLQQGQVYILTIDGRTLKFAL